MTYNLNHKTRIKDLKTLTEEVFTKYTTLRDRTAALEDLCAILGRNSPGLRNSIFRGINLGEFTSDHLASIKNGTYKNMWVGDYFTIENKSYAIMGFNCFGRGISGSEGHMRKHIVLMCRNNFPQFDTIPNTFNVKAGVISEDDPGTWGNPYPTSNWYVNIRPRLIEYLTERFTTLETFHIQVPTNNEKTAWTTLASKVHLPTFQMLTGIPLYSYENHINCISWKFVPSQLPFYRFQRRGMPEGAAMAEPWSSTLMISDHFGFFAVKDIGYQALKPVFCVG